MGRIPLQVLLIPREDPDWEWARANPYSFNFAWEEGLRANGVECTTLPVFANVPTSAPAWIQTAREVCAGRRFDQVWIEAIYSPFDEATLQWLSALAPVRLGFVWESFEFIPPVLGEAVATDSEPWAKSMVERRLPYLTHLLLCDEKDAEEVQRSGRAAAMWGPNAVPARFICDDAPPPLENQAIFAGTLYEKRKEWLSSAGLRAPLGHLTPPQDATLYPLLFNELNQTIVLDLLDGLSINERLLSGYLSRIRMIRREVYGIWLGGLRRGCAIVNLPHYVKTYAARVVESIAAGRPVISWNIPDRPRNRDLFEDGKEILLFPEDDPSVCETHMERIMNDPQFAARIAGNARRKLRSFHTTEKRVGHILHWVETGDAPTYGAA